MSQVRRYGPVPKLQRCFKQLVEAFENGLPQRTAAMLVGISYNTLHRWMVNGEQELRWQEQEDDPQYAAATMPDKYHDGVDRDPLYAEFFVEVCQARANYQRYLIDRVKSASDDPKHWQAAAFLLEHANPHDFGKAAADAAGPADPAAMIPTDQQERAANALLEQLALLKRLPSGVIEVKAS